MIWLRAALCVAAILSSPLPVSADTLRVASYNVELQRDGPGLLLRDLIGGENPQIDAVVRVIARVSPDILALQGFDWDYDNAALSALANRLGEAGAPYPHKFSLRPNSGLATDLDLDGDGQTGGPRDAQGFGAFSGQAGMAVLSRFPIQEEKARDFSNLLWRDMPGARLPVRGDAKPFPSEEAAAIQRLSSMGHWIVPISLPGGKSLSLWTFHAGPPVFDGPEDRNGLRNHDEILFWRAVLDAKFGAVPGWFVLAGDANLDPFDSDGRTEAIRQLLADPRLRDPAPQSDGAARSADQGHRNPNRLDTVEWDGPGRLRVDYVLPAAEWEVVGSGVFWPAPGQDGHADALAASRHRLVWVDLVLE